MQHLGRAEHVPLSPGPRAGASQLTGEWELIQLVRKAYGA